LLQVKRTNLADGIHKCHGHGIIRDSGKRQDALAGEILSASKTPGKDFGGLAGHERHFCRVDVETAENGR
jgi:hypothetical protein